MIGVENQAVRDREQRARKLLAISALDEGGFDNALLIIRSVLAEEMSPAVAAECYSTEAAILADMGDFRGSLESLDRMAEYLEAAEPRTQGTFYNARGRAHKNLGDISSALVDYAGAIAFWQSCRDQEYEGAVSINLAELYLEIDRLEQANESVDHALKVLPCDSKYLCNAYDTKAKVLLKEGHTVSALRLIERALTLAGVNEHWQKRFSDTKQLIKEELLEVLVPLVQIPDLENLKDAMIRNALEKSKGSITDAADMLHTSRQVIAYNADHKGFDRAKRKKSIIKVSS